MTTQSFEVSLQRAKEWKQYDPNQKTRNHISALIEKSKSDPGAKEEIEKLLAEYPLWHRIGKTIITRKFTAKNWQCAADFFSQLSTVAEEEGHHPDFKLTNYREVEVSLSTHAIGALSMYDFILAAKLDKIPVVYSPKWERENIKQNHSLVIQC